MEDLEVRIGKRAIAVGRSLELARRVEGAVGPLWEFAQRLDAGRVTYAEAGRLYETLVRDHPDAPDRDVIDTWLFDVGLFAHKATSWFLASLVTGSKLLEQERRRLTATQREAEAKDREQQGANGPFARTAA